GIAGCEPIQVACVGTGLSGITRSGPALSVSSRTGAAIFTVYENGKYDIYALDGAGRPTLPTDLSAVALSAKAEARSATVGGALPPVDRRDSEVLGLLTNATLGLPPSSNYETAKY